MSNKPKIGERTKMTRKESLGAIRNLNKGSKSIDFGERKLPKTILVDVPTSVVKLGNETQRFNDIAPLCVVGNTVDSSMNLIATLRGIPAGTVDKVILDNHDGFKIKTLDELIADLEDYIAKTYPADQDVATNLEPVIDEE